MTDLTEDGRREQFEAWARTVVADDPLDFTPCKNNCAGLGFHYLDPTTAWAYSAWTARAARERELLRILGKIHEQATRRWREGPENGSLANDLDNIVSLAANVISTSPIAKAALSETQPEEPKK